MTPSSPTPAIFAGSSAYPKDGPGPVLSIGNFDGVHAGHRHLLAKVVARARALDAPACIYTFDPPPRVVLAPSAHQRRILGWPDKVRLLAAEGVDQVVVERFTRAFAQHPPEWFVEEILGRRLRPRALVVGHDFRFGKARAGDLAMVQRLLPDIPIDHVDALQDDGTVSSSRIRESVLAGRVAEAGHLLGRHHFVKGTVVSGDKRGRRIGFPTANLDTDAELLPPAGVYAVRARIDGEGWRDGVANLGVRPTFGAGGFSVEVYVLDYRGDLYGREVAVAFVERLRGEQKFSDVMALQDQIRDDVLAARGVLSAHR